MVAVIEPSGLSANGVHRPAGLHESSGVNLVPFPLRPNRSTDRFDERRSVPSVPQERLDVRLLKGEETMPKLAVGRQP